jgi:hypothetical protein
MAFVIQGNQITEFSAENGPEGKVLRGEGETGLASHTEACQAARERRSHSTTVGFPDTPEAERVFEELRQARRESEQLEAAQPAEDEPAAAAEAPEAEPEGGAGKPRRAPKGG